MAITAAQFGSSNGFQPRTIEVSAEEVCENGVIILSEMSAWERDIWDGVRFQFLEDELPDSKHGYRAVLLWLCARDDQGNRLFTNREQLNRLAANSGEKWERFLTRCYRAALDLNPAVPVTVEDAAKN